MKVVYNKDYFRKYTSIDNFQTAMMGNRTIKPMKYGAIFVSEKLDGANLGAYLSFKDETVSFFSRNGENASGLFSFADYLPTMEDLFASIHAYFKHLSHNCEGIYLYGEYIGNKVMRRINYDVANRVVFYDMFFCMKSGDMIQVDPLTFRTTFTEFIEQNNKYSENFLFTDCILLGETPIEDVFRLLPLPFKSGFSPKGDNAEGYVITYINEFGKCVKWKLKDERFKERKGTTNPKANSNIFAEKVFTLQRVFKEFFTLTRAEGILTKTTERKRVDVLVKTLIEDAKVDFLKEYGDQIRDLTDKEKRRIYNIGSMPFLLMKEALALDTQN